ncbi:MAG: serine/threonine-protein kinase, partial [Prosthecobacter sp.]
METDTTRLIPKKSNPESVNNAAALFGIGLEDELPPNDDSTIIVLPPSTHRDITLGEKSGDYIGRYCLREVLGEGGFGMVWLAEQHEPIRREVALKVIKAGMDSQEIISRFDTERQALALMDHPNIAGVLDAGATSAGRPFFVMELVKGPAITKYCDEKRLTVRQRLELFIPICQAVQHAHQKAILHRDLKPSNILVTEVDSRPVPMVIDFGIAKALGTSDAAGFVGDIVQTMQGVIIGTPQYMSPEQAGLDNLDVDTRSDIYSLGVILFELLTGETPLPIEVARKSPIDEILRHIREEDAKRPSSRLIQLTEKVRATAELRHTHVPRLTQVLKRDLDWIVLRALEKDRERRYDTATSLMLDIQRYLNDEPVSATPPSVAYRFMKMVRRHRKTMATAAAIVISLIVGLATTTFALEREKAALTREAAERVEAVRARGQAETAQQQEAAARATAEERRIEAEKARIIAVDERSKAVSAAEAERQAKQIATSARNKAETLIEDMLIDLRGKLVPLGRSALLATVAESADKYFTDLPPESLNDVQWRQRAMIAEFRGMIDLSRGDRVAAQVQFDACLDILNRRVQNAPQNPAYLRDLAVASQGVGVGHEEAGQFTPARKMFERQLSLLTKLIALQPKEPLNQ